MTDLNFIERKILQAYMTKWFKDHWPTIVSVAGFAIPFLIPSFNAYIGAHPHSTEATLLTALLAAYYSTAPKDKPKP